MKFWLGLLAILGFVGGTVGLVIGYNTENLNVMVFWGVIALMNQATLNSLQRD